MLVYNFIMQPGDVEFNKIKGQELGGRKPGTFRIV